jgi:hypothetical protein
MAESARTERAGVLWVVGVVAPTVTTAAGFAAYAHWTAAPSHEGVGLARLGASALIVLGIAALLGTIVVTALALAGRGGGVLSPTAARRLATASGFAAGTGATMPASLTATIVMALLSRGPERFAPVAAVVGLLFAGLGAGRTGRRLLDDSDAASGEGEAVARELDRRFVVASRFATALWLAAIFSAAAELRAATLGNFDGILVLNLTWISIFAAATGAAVRRRTPATIASAVASSPSSRARRARAIFGVALPALAAIASAAYFAIEGRRSDLSAWVFVAACVVVVLVVPGVFNYAALAAKPWFRDETGARVLAAIAGVGAATAMFVSGAAIAGFTFLGSALERRDGSHEGGATLFVTATIAMVGAAAGAGAPLAARNSAREAALRHEMTTGSRVRLLPAAWTGWAVTTLAVGLAWGGAVGPRDEPLWRHLGGYVLAMLAVNLLVLPCLVPLAMLGHRRLVRSAGP